MGASQSRTASAAAKQPGQGERRILYRNAAVFVAFAAVAIVLMLGVVLAVPGASRLRVMFVAAVAGIVGVIIYLLVEIGKFEKRVKDQLTNAQNAIVRTESCPDFYTASRQPDGSTLCKNGVTSRRSGASFAYASRKDRPVPDRVSLSTIDGQPYSAVCKAVDPVDATTPAHNVPWSALRPQCRALASTPSGIAA